MIQIPRDQTQALPDLQVPQDQPIEAFGGGQSKANVYRAAQGIADTASKIEIEKLDDTLKTASDDATNKLIAKGTELKRQVESVKGKDALAASQKAMADYDAYKQELEKSIGNNTVKKVVSSKYPSLKLNLGSFTEEHAARQMEWYEDQTFNAKVGEMQNSASVDQTPGNIVTSIMGQKLEIEDYGRRRGLPPEQIKGLQSKAVSSTHMNAIEALGASRQDAKLRDYYDANKDELYGDDATRAAKMMQNATTQGNAYRKFDEIFAPKEEVTQTANGARVDIKPGVTNMSEVLAQTDKIKDPDERRMVESLARQRFADLKNAEKQQNENAFMAVAKRIEQYPGVDPQGLATPAEWTSMTDPDTKTALRKLAFPKEEMEYKALTGLVLTPDKELSGYSDAELLQKFGFHMFEKAKDRRDTIRKGGPSYEAAKLEDDTIMSVFLKSGLGGVKPSDTEAEIKKDTNKSQALWRFWETVNSGRMASQIATGKKADSKTTLEQATSAAAYLQKKVKIFDEATFITEGALSDLIPGYALFAKNPTSEKAISDLSSDEIASAQIEMPREFAQSLFEFARARPGTVPNGMEFNQWKQKDRAGINRAYLAEQRGASPAEIRLAYLRGK